MGIDVTPLLGPPTGIPAVTRGLVGALAARDDIELSGWLLSARAGSPELPLGMECVNRRIPAAFVHRAWSRSNWPPGPVITGRVDVVHGTNYVAPPGAKSVITIQDLSPISHPDWTGPSIARMGVVTRRAVQRGAVVHVPCQRIADEARDLLGVTDDRLRVVHNAIGPVSTGDPDAGRRHSGGHRYVLALGTVGRRKALPTLVEAMAALPADIHLVVAGPKGDAEPDLIRSVRESGLDDRFHRISSLDDKSRDDLLSGALVLAFPSLYEGYGLPPLEALAAGVPVVATDVGALAELTQGAVALVEPGNSSAFAEALEALCSDPESPPAQLSARLSALTWTHAAEGLVEAYRLAAI